MMNANQSLMNTTTAILPQPVFLGGGGLISPGGIMTSAVGSGGIMTSAVAPGLASFAGGMRATMMGGTTQPAFGLNPGLPGLNQQSPAGPMGMSHPLSGYGA